MSAVEPYVISPGTVGDNGLLAAQSGELHGLIANMAMVANTATLTVHEKSELRRCAVRAARMGVSLEPLVHYTQSSLRWSGITDRRRSINHQAPPYADCSSFVSWCYWDAAQWLHPEDFMNGSSWLAGYTGTLVQHGKQISEAQLQPGDLCFYGSLTIPYHVTMYIGSGQVISHGREQGPEIVGLGPVTQFRAYVL